MALLHSAQSLAASLLGLARTRLELFSTEAIAAAVAASIGELEHDREALQP